MINLSRNNTFIEVFKYRNKLYRIFYFDKLPKKLIAFTFLTDDRVNNICINNAIGIISKKTTLHRLLKNKRVGEKVWKM